MKGVTKRKSGGYQSSFTVEGRRYYSYGATPKECREKEMAKRLEVEKGLSQTGKNAPFNKFSSEWLENKRGEVIESSYRTQGILLKIVCEASVKNRGGVPFGSLRLKDILPQDIRDVQTEIVKKRATRTANDSIHYLKAVLQSAVNDRIIEWNPAAGIKPLKRTEEQARNTTHRALSREETETFLKAAEAKNSYYLPLYIFLLNTGLRLGEAGALRQQDIRNGGVNIERTITRNAIGGYEIGNATKTEAGKRFVPLNPAAAEAIKKQKEQRKMLGTSKFSFMDPIYCTAKGTLLKSSIVNSDIERVCKAAGIERFSAHAFRATFCTRAVESGMQPKTLQSIMGHQDIEMTMGLYAHCSDSTKKSELMAVDFG